MGYGINCKNSDVKRFFTSVNKIKSSKRNSEKFINQTWKTHFYSGWHIHSMEVLWLRDIFWTKRKRKKSAYFGYKWTFPSIHSTRKVNSVFLHFFRFCMCFQNYTVIHSVVRKYSVDLETWKKYAFHFYLFNFGLKA